MAYAIKRGRVWYACFKNADGRDTRRSTTATKESDAIALATQLEAKEQALRGASTEETRTWALGDLVGWWIEQLPEGSSARKDRSAAQRILRHEVANLSLGELRAFHVERFLSDLKSADGRPSAPDTKKKTPGLLQRAFKLAKKLGHWRGANPMADVERVKVPKSEIGDLFLTPEEIPRVLAVLDDSNRRLVATAVHTGMRKGELAALQKQDVDLELGTVTVRRSWERETTKGAHHDVLPIHPELAPYLAEAIAASTSERVFPWVKPNTKLPEMLRAALVRAGIPSRRVRFHDLRHSAASVLLAAGINATVVQAVARHRDPRTTMRYAHLAAGWTLRQIERRSLLPTV